MTDIFTRSPDGDLNRPAGHADPSPATTVTQKAADAGSDVVSSVKEQSGQVAGEAGRQARDLYGQARTQVAEQVSGQQKRAVGGMYSLADELARMADDGDSSGPAHHLARQASDRINSVAEWLEHREPGHVLDEVTAYARRKPGMFLLGAALLGTVAGRLSKNLIGGSDETPTSRAYNSPSAGMTPPPSAMPPVDSWADPHIGDDPQNGRA